MRMQSTLYDRLKVAPDAPPEVLRAAYKALAQKFHPDRNADPSATAMMALINEAFRVLSDPQLRLEYDRGLDLEPTEQHAPEEPKSRARRANQPTHTAASADPPARSPRPEVVGEIVDLEAMWKTWFRKSTPAEPPSQEYVKGARTTRPSASHTVDLENIWRNLFGGSGSAGKSKRDAQK